MLPTSISTSRISQLHLHSAPPSEDMNIGNDEDLLKSVEVLEKQLELLEIESEIYENVLMKLDPSLMDGVKQAIDYAYRIQSHSSMRFSEKGSRMTAGSSRIGTESLLFMGSSRTLGSVSRVMSTRKLHSTSIMNAIVGGHGPKIVMDEKLEIVERELDSIADSLKSVKESADKRNVLFKAQFEELSKRKRTIDSFLRKYKEEVLEKGVDPLTHRIPGEEWVKHMRENTKTLDKRLGKLRLRLTTFNSRYFKLKGALKYKAEISEVLRPVDFEKLEILNQEYTTKIARKTIELGKVKRLTGDANLTLTVHRRCMVKQDNFVRDVRKNIAKKKYQIQALRRDAKMILKEAEQTKLLVAQVKNLFEKYKIPDTFAYLNMKLEYHNLIKQMNILKRRNYGNHELPKKCFIGHNLY